ncbi:MAG: NAD-dependent deacylase [Solibacillus sp.]
MSVELLKDWLLASTNTVVLTGAGMSTESGIPDFRSASGLWRGVDPRTVASVEALEGNYELFRSFYQQRIEALEQCVPHKGYEILAAWQKRGLISFIATQNVDRFHEAAGAVNVQELHGNITTIRCRDCNRPRELAAFLAGDVCLDCGGKLRPNVVLFGEMLPNEAWQKSLQAIEQADLVLVIGTSLEVYPVNQLPAMTQGKLVYINLETANERGFDLVLQGRAGEILVQVDSLL